MGKVKGILCHFALKKGGGCQAGRDQPTNPLALTSITRSDLTNSTNVVMLTDINPAAVDFAWGSLALKKLQPKTPAQ
jgi:hypothetical protein